MAMPTIPLLALHLLMTPVSYGEGCNPGPPSPQVDVTVERGAPSVSSGHSIAALTQQSAGAYKPPGTGGPTLAHRRVDAIEYR